MKDIFLVEFFRILRHREDEKQWIFECEAEVVNYDEEDLREIFIQRILDIENRYELKISLVSTRNGIGSCKFVVVTK